MLTGMRTIGLTVSGDGVNTATVDMDFPPIWSLEYKIDIRTGKIVRKPLVSIPTDDRPKGQKKRAGKRSR